MTNQSTSHVFHLAACTQNFRGQGLNVVVEVPVDELERNLRGGAGQRECGLGSVLILNLKGGRGGRGLVRS